MRYLILKAAHLSRRTRERVGDLERLFEALLAEPGQTWVTHDIEHGEFPATLEGCAGLVITGSPAAAYDRESWVLRLLELLREAHGRGIPLLGVCFGAQAVAQALGGEVQRNPLGWDLGVVELELSEAGTRWPPLAGAPRPLRILETHADIVTRLPPGATVLARSARTPVEIYTLGDRVLCLQGHPELDNAIVRELIEKRLERGLLEPQRAAEGLASLEREPHRDFLQAWLRAFLREGRLPAVA
jgi:GMP synthase-like glutamine amidotransferase